MCNFRKVVINKDEFNTSPEKYENLIVGFYHENGDCFSREELNVSNQINNQNVFYGALMSGDRIISLARFAKIYYAKTIYMVRQIDTLKEFRGRGLGTACLCVADDYLRGIGASKLISLVDSDNIPSVKIHLNSGYKEVEPSKRFKQSHYYWDAVCFEKTFDKSFNNDNGELSDMDFFEKE